MKGLRNPGINRMCMSFGKNSDIALLEGSRTIDVSADSFPSWTIVVQAEILCNILPCPSILIILPIERRHLEHVLSIYLIEISLCLCYLLLRPPSVRRCEKHSVLTQTQQQ